MECPDLTRTLPLVLRPLLLFVCLFFASGLWAQTVYLKPADALRIIFKDSAEIISEKKTLTPAERTILEKKLGGKLAKESWNFYSARTGGKVDGYALIDNEVGKTEPITFLTAITPSGEVKEVEILVYREPIGSEVHEKRFLRQYQGKRGVDPIRVGQDIANISGATLSARAVSQGVKRALALWELFYGKN